MPEIKEQKTMSDMIKEIKCMIRNNNSLLQQWKEEEISFGRMAEELSKSISTISDKQIEQLQAENKRLRAALKEYASENNWEGDYPKIKWYSLENGFRVARAALDGKGEL